jgi:hypothetical protein
VRALQDDVDAQYKRLDMAVRGFWVRPSEARVQVGMVADPELDTLWLNRAAAMPGGGFGGGAQALPAPADGKALETKADDETLEDFPELVQTMLDAAAPRLEAQLNGYFDNQRKRVKRALLSNG